MTPNFKKGFDTICIKDDTRYSSIAHTTPIFASSTYVYESPEKAMEVFRGNEEAFIYGRWNHPNVELVENKLTALESFGLENLEAKGYLFSTGMAAIAALFNSTLSAGGTIIAQGNIYGLQ
jgi:methionine-gamma-lyase